MKRLYRSRKNRVICGVCGGIGDYLNVDPTVIRLLALLLGFTGTGFVKKFLKILWWDLRVLPKDFFVMGIGKDKYECFAGLYIY